MAQGGKVVIVLDPTRDLTMQDVRLMAGEGKLTNADVLAACNAEMRRRAKHVAPVEVVDLVERAQRAETLVRDLSTALTTLAAERDENEGVFKVWRRRATAVEAREAKLREALNAVCPIFRQVWDAFCDGSFEIEINDLITVEGVKSGLIDVTDFDPETDVDESGACQPGDDFYRLTDLGRAALIPVTPVEESER